MLATEAALGLRRGVAQHRATAWCGGWCVSCVLCVSRLISLGLCVICAFVVYLCLSSSSDDHLLSHSCLGTGMRFGTQNKFCHYRASLVHSVSLHCFLIPVGALVGAVSRYCHSWCRLFGPLHILGRVFVRCVLVNTLQYHDTVEFVQDSETEDPQVVAEPGVGTKPWQDNGKELMRTEHWDHGLDRIHLQVSQPQHWRTRTDIGNAIFDSGRQPHRCRRTGRGDGSSRQLKGESRTAAEVVMDDALVQDDGIDLIVEELDGCWEVTQDQDKASKIEKALLRDTKGTSTLRRPSCPMWQGGSLTFNNWRMHWGRHYQQ